MWEIAPDLWPEQRLSRRQVAALEQAGPRLNDENLSQLKAEPCVGNVAPTLVYARQAFTCRYAACFYTSPRSQAPHS